MKNYKKFSKEFQNELLDLYELCYNNNTDGCTVTFEYSKAILEVNFTFIGKLKGGGTSDSDNLNI